MVGFGRRVAVVVVLLPHLIHNSAETVEARKAARRAAEPARRSR